MLLLSCPLCIPTPSLLQELETTLAQKDLQLSEKDHQVQQLQSDLEDVAAAHAAATAALRQQQQLNQQLQQQLAAAHQAVALELEGLRATHAKAQEVVRQQLQAARRRKGGGRGERDGGKNGGVGIGKQGGEAKQRDGGGMEEGVLLGVGEGEREEGQEGQDEGRQGQGSGEGQERQDEGRGFVKQGSESKDGVEAVVMEGCSEKAVAEAGRGEEVEAVGVKDGSEAEAGGDDVDVELLQQMLVVGEMEKRGVQVSGGGGG